MLIKVATYNIHKAIGTDGLYAPDRILATLEEM
jgi:endonuclease/exonuclease/phosphatase family metal-dependent hydrolase